MTTAELLAIIDAVKVEKLSHAQAAIRFRVTKTLISRLVTQSRKDKTSLRKAEAKEELRRLKLRAVLTESSKLLASK